MSNPTDVWERSIISGVVLKMAQTYENQAQVLQALVLYIKAFDFYYHFTDSLEVCRFIEPLKRLRETVGEARFWEIWKATTGSIGDAFLIDDLSLKIAIEESKPLKSLAIEHQLEPDEDFLHVWQVFLQSVQERLAIILANDRQEVDFDWNPYREEFGHLHLPSESAYVETRSIPNDLEVQQIEDMEQSLEDNNPYAFFRYVKTLKNHTAPVYSVAFCPDGQTLVSGSADTTIKLWNLKTGQEISTLTGHASSVLSVAVSPDGETLVSGSADATIKLWNLKTGQEIRTLNADSGFVFAVCFHPSRQLLASAHSGPGEDRTINLWNLNIGEVICTMNTYEEVASVKISPDGQTLASAGANGAYRPVIRLWNLNTGKVITTFEDYSSIYHELFTYTIAFSFDGQLLASGDRDTTVKLWGILSPLTIE